MKNTCKICHTDRTIVMDRTFAKLAENTRSEEYRHLQQIRRDYPEYTVITRSIAKNPDKNSFKGLNYEYMRDYIILHVSPEEENAALAEFDELILISRCQSKKYRYPTIKKWFLNKYPEVRDFKHIPSVIAENNEKEAS